MEFMMGLVAKKHQAFNPYSFQTIAREHNPSLNLSFFEHGPLSMVCSSPQLRPRVWRIDPDEESFLQAGFSEAPFRLDIERDQLGSCPCFYLDDREKFIFSSDFYGLAKFLGDAAFIDKQAVAQYLSTGISWGGSTIFQNIKMLSSQHSLVFERPKVVLNKIDDSGRGEVPPQRSFIAQGFNTDHVPFESQYKIKQLLGLAQNESFEFGTGAFFEFSALELEDNGARSQVLREKQNARIGIFDPVIFRQILEEGSNSILLKRCLKLNNWMDELDIVAKKGNGLTRLMAKLEGLFYG